MPNWLVTWIEWVQSAFKHKYNSLKSDFTAVGNKKEKKSAINIILYDFWLKLNTI